MTAKKEAFSVNELEELKELKELRMKLESFKFSP